MENLTSIFLILGALSVAHVVIVLLVIFIALPIFLLIHFLPSILAYKKEHFIAILLINIFLGWTVIGWIASLIWALTDTPKVEINIGYSSVKIGENKVSATISEELNRLKSMKDNGMINEEEFSKAKNKILS